MDGFLHFLEIFALCVGVLVLIAAILFAVVYYLPNSPLKEILRAFGQRVAATAAVGLVGLPLQPIPEVDGIYDIGGLIVLAIYWYGLIHKVRHAKDASEARSHLKQAAPTILQMLRNRKRFRR